MNIVLLSNYIELIKYLDRLFILKIANNLESLNELIINDVFDFIIVDCLIISNEQLGKLKDLSPNSKLLLIVNKELLHLYQNNIAIDEIMLRPIYWEYLFYKLNVFYKKSLMVSNYTNSLLDICVSEIEKNNNRLAISLNTLNSQKDKKESVSPSLYIQKINLLCNILKFSDDQEISKSIFDTMVRQASNIAKLYGVEVNIKFSNTFSFSSFSIPTKRLITILSICLISSSALETKHINISLEYNDHITILVNSTKILDYDIWSNFIIKNYQDNFKINIQDSNLLISLSEDFGYI